MPKRLLALWIILCTLGVGASWALDTHDVIVGQATSLEDVHHQEEGSADEHHHCDHLAFHLLGLGNATPTAALPTRDEVNPTSAAALLSKFPEPPTQPPRV